MEYDRLIRDAWAITWRYRFLWVLGLLAGGAVGLPGLNGSSGANGGSNTAGQGGLGQASPSFDTGAQQFAAWATANVGLLVGLAAFAPERVGRRPAGRQRRAGLARAPSPGW